MTIETLDKIMYNLTYENGCTFGMCGTAKSEQYQQLVHQINFYENRDKPPKELCLS